MEVLIPDKRKVIYGFFLLARENAAGNYPGPVFPPSADTANISCSVAQKPIVPKFERAMIFLKCLFAACLLLAH